VIDIKALREDPERFRLSQKVRGERTEIVDELLALDEARRIAITNFEALRAEQNSLSKSVGAAQGGEKVALLESAKELSNQVKEADAIRARAEEAARSALLQIHNLISPQAPVGGEGDFVVLEHVGTPRDFAVDGFEPKDHVELGKILKAIDTERGAKVSGSRSYYLTGPGALLEFALINFAIASATKAASHL
jgi:seryl-tRNA synthetase